MTDAEAEAAGDDAYIAEDATDYCNKSKQLALSAAVVAVPVYAWLTDKLSTEYEIIFAFGVRSIAGFCFYSSTDPSKEIVIYTIVAYMLSGNF